MTSQAIIEEAMKAEQSLPQAKQVPKVEMSVEEEASKAREHLSAAQSTVINVSEPEPPSALERILSQPYNRAVDRMEGTISRTLDPQNTQGMSLPELQQSGQQSQPIGSTVVQIASTPVSLGLDVIGSTIGVGAEKAWGLVPESSREGVSQFFMEMLNTDEGKAALQAASKGVEYWNKFKENNPGVAANIEAGLDIFGGVPKNIVSEATLDQTPLVLTKVGLRNEVKPLAGGDADVWNIAYKGDKKTVEQAANTSGPQGPLGSQRQLATGEQLEVVDSLKEIGVNGSQTLQENFNTLIKGLDDLDDKLIAASRKVRRPVDLDVWRQNINQEIRNLKEQMPDVFNDPAMSKKLEKAYAKMMAKLDEQGNSVEGVIAARRAFDAEFARQGVDAGSSLINPSVIASRVLRNATNKSISQSLPESTNIFGKMSRLLSVYDTMGGKAAREAKTNIGRYVAELGLDSMAGENFTSKLINGAYLLGMTPVMAPYKLMKDYLKRPSPARGRAKVAYVLRDIKDEISKGLSRIQDPVKKRALLANQATVYASLEEAARQIMQEEDY